jgi:putative hydrolase of HD superfamily
LLKLIKGLEPRTKKEIFDYWMEYERMKSREGRFVKQGDKVETLLQALEYWGSEPDTPVMGWWEEVGEIVDDPILEEFLDGLKNSFYGKKKLSGEVDFLLKIGQFKKKPRSGWIIRGVKDPETIIEHAFLMSMAVWLLGKKKRLNHEKMLKMSLAYEICEIYAGDETPYDKITSKENKDEALKRWPKMLKKEKERIFLLDYNKEKKALEKLTRNLSPDLGREIIRLWDECKRQSTFEGTFVSQVYWLTTYLQALQYYKEDSAFPIFAWYEQVRQYIYDPMLIEFLKLEEKKFLSKKAPIYPA